MSQANQRRMMTETVVVCIEEFSF